MSEEESDWTFRDVLIDWRVSLRNIRTSKIIVVKVTASNTDDAFNKARATRGRAADDYAEISAEKLR